MSEEKEKETTPVVEEQNQRQEESSLSKRIDLEKILGESGYEYYLENKSKVHFSVGGIAIIIIAILGYQLVWQNMIVLPKEKKSIEQLWQAESNAFDLQNWETAINGDSLGLFTGFNSVTKDFAGYSGGEIAKYDLGISYLNNKEYENAITTLKEISIEDELIGTIALGAIGDAYIQLGSVSDAFSYYEKAYTRRDNEMTSPIYIMKAALCLEIEKKYDEAIELYNKLVVKYPNSTLSIKAEKYMESLKLGKPVYQFDVQEIE